MNLNFFRCILLIRKRNLTDLGLRPLFVAGSGVTAFACKIENIADKVNYNAIVSSSSYIRPKVPLNKQNDLSI